MALRHIETLHTDINEKYTIGAILGTGTFSEVKLCVNKATGEEYAVKIMDKEKGNKRKMEIITVEIEILKRVWHDNIVKLHELYETDTQYFLVLQRITGGELFDKIVELVHYSEKDASNLIKQVLAGVGHMHECNVVHRDLKPENLLLSSDSVEADVVITDFGLSAIVKDEKERLKRAVGTPGYLAPEVLETLETDEGYGREVDLWGVGVILYILLCGFPPFYGEDDEEVYDKICDGDYSYPSPYWDNISESAKDLIDHLLVLDPSKRFNVEQALAHPWIQENAPTKHLDTTLQELAKFNARRKLKKAMFGVLAMAKFKSAFGKKTPKPLRKGASILEKIKAQQAVEEAAAAAAAAAPSE